MSHHQVVIIGAGPAGLLLARMLFNSGIDSIILENRNEAFLRENNRGGFLEKNIVQLLEEESLKITEYGIEETSTQITKKGIPLNQIDFHIANQKYVLPLNRDTENSGAFIYDQKLIINDLIDGLKRDGQVFIFEAKGQRYENLQGEKVKIVYTLNGQIYDMTCDYVVGCDGFRGISRRSIPRAIREETKEGLPYAWLEWIVKGVPTSKYPIIAFQEEGFAMQTINADRQTRYYLQVKRGIEVDDLPPDHQIWDIIEKRLGIKVKRGGIKHKKLDYMRSFSTNTMQFGRLFIAGDAAHQVPRLGSKGVNMAFGDAARLAKGFIELYENKNPYFLSNYTKNCLASNLKIIEYTNLINQLFHQKEGVPYSTQVNKAKELVTVEQKKIAFQNYLIG